jgi:hypothetical protein
MPKLARVLLTGSVLLGLLVLNLPAANAGDTTAPVVTVTSPPTQYLLGMSAGTAAWTIEDESPTSTQFYVLSQHYKGQSYGVFSTVTGTNHQTLVAAAGWTTCSVLTVLDSYQNAGYSEADDNSCATTPLDDLDLLQSPNDWTSKVKTGNYRRTLSMTKKQGSTLQLKNALFSDLAVVATKCPGCGKIQVKVGSQTKDFSLDSNSVKRKQLLKWRPVPDPNVARTISIKVLSNNKLVVIDGLGVMDRRLAECC